jgi:predicted AAA+ superfamily ATPase
MRYLAKYILDDSKKKMVFLTGPRQSGKTTLVLDLLKDLQGIYLNWDDQDHRRQILKRDWSDEDTYVALDEIHKYSRWKNFLKGTYDTQKDKHRFIITGSAKLDIYKKGQDSMLGRFFSWRVHPLCLSELKHHFKNNDESNLDKLIKLGGFPEPFFEGREVYAKRWRKEKLKLVFRQDIQELESIKDISLLELFYQGITERVGSEIVVSNMARDLEIAPKTAKAWLNILEKTYAVFVVPPYGKGIAKAITKTPKVYLYDNGEVYGEEGAKFENLVATHLYKRIQFLEDLYGDKYELNYLRDKNGHEVDFVILKNNRPVSLIEAKLNETTRSKSLYYYKERLKVDHCLQLIKSKVKTQTKDQIVVTSAYEWLSMPLESEIF